MKIQSYPCSRSLNLPARHLMNWLAVAVLFAAFGLGTACNAAVWINPAGGLWSTAANWTNNIIPTGAGDTADFSTLDITADTTVNLDSAQTIGNLIFGDADTTTAAGWTLANNGVPANILTLAGTTPTVTVNALADTEAATISAVVAGTSGLTKTGDGTLILSGVNTYTGDTTISGGNVAIGGAGQLGGGTYAGNITNNAALTLDTSAAQTLSGVISGTGALTTSGSGTLTLPVANTYTGGTTNSGGSLIAANANAFGPGPVTVDTAAVVTTINDGLTVTNDFNLNGGNGAYAGLIMNSGSGNATLSGGTITVNGLPGSGGEFAGASTGTLTVADPINSSLTVTWRSGNGIFSGGGSYPNFNITGNLKLGANNGLAQNAIVNIGNSGAATLDLAGYNQTLAGITRVANNAAVITNSSTTTPSTLTTTDTSTYPGAIADAGGAGTVAVTVNGGQLTLSGTNSYTGNTTLAAGILNVGSPESAGTKGPLGTGGLILFSGGTLQYSAANTYDYSPRFSTAAGQAYSIDTDGQTVTLATGLASSGGTLTVADATYSSGILILSGASTYSGATTVTAGKLYVNGSLNSASAVSVTGYGTTLGGQGNVGAVTLSSGGSVEGGQGGAGILTMTSLAFSDSGIVVATPNATTAPVKVTAANGLNPAGGAGSVTINLAGGALLPGTYHVIQYSGTIQGSGFSAFTLGPTPGGAYSYALVNNAGYVDVVVTALADIWTGAFSTEWSVNAITSPKNWTETGVGAVDYADGQDTLFDDTATGTTVDISVADVNPGSVQFFNASKDYTLQGSKGIANIGSGGLVKNGTGTLTINNTNSFYNDVTVNGGTLSVSDLENGSIPSPLGAGYNINLGGGKLSYTGAGSSSDRTVTLNSASTVEVTAAPATLALMGTVGGTADLTKTGNGTLNLSGYGAYTGNTIINAGTLTVGDPGLLGSGTYAGNITNNAAFVYGSSQSQTISGVISGAGAVTQSGGGTLTLSGVNTYTADTTISAGTFTIGGAGRLGGGSYAGNIADNGVFNYGSTAAQTLSGVISGSGALTTSGSGALTLSGANIYTGGTTVAPSSDITGLVVANASALGTGSLLVEGKNQYSASVSVKGGMNITNAVTLQRGTSGSGRATIGVGAVASSAIWSGPITVDNTAGSGFGGILFLSTNAANADIVSGNISYSTLGTGSSANPSFVFRNTGGYGEVTGSVSLDTGYLQLLDSVKVEFSNAANTWGTLDINHAAAVAYVGAANTLSASGVVYSSVGGTLQMNNLAGTTAYDQIIAGLSRNVKVSLATGSATLTLNTTADQFQTNVIAGAVNLVKTGPASQTLAGTNTYSGSTTINAGTLVLGATGSISNSPNIVIAGGATLDVSTTAFRLLKSQTLSNSTSTAILNGSLIATSGVVSVTYASDTAAFTVNNGTLTIGSNTVINVNNTGPALAAGSYKLISAGTGGAVAGTLPLAASVTGGGLASGMANSLQIINSELYLVVQAFITSTNSPVLANSVSGSTLTLSWPADHLGWHLQDQTNSLASGLGTNWVNIPGSDSMTSTNITINPASPAVFYRLVYP